MIITLLGLIKSAVANPSNSKMKKMMSKFLEGTMVGKRYLCPDVVTLQKAQYKDNQ